MKHKRFEENILIDEAYTSYGKPDKNADQKKGQGIAKHFAETLEYEEKKKWFHQLPEELGTTSKSLTEDQIENLRKEANSALHGDTLAYETKSNKNGSSDQQWARTLLNKGAIADRVAAATILIQDNPLYNLTALRNLVNSVKPAKKKDGIIVIDALSELLISELLMPDVKLRTFEQHPLCHLDEMTSGNKHARRNILKIWYYEDQLKELYGTYVEALNKFAHDSVEANKEKAVSAMSYLLMHHPEREKMLLNNIINKLGDPSASVASKVVYHLCQLLYNHPNMKAVVLKDIEKMLFRTNISPRAQYYGVCFLNQFFLGKDDSKIAEDLIRIYFSFFKASVKKGEVDSRLMSAILTGVKRAFPFADRDRVTSSNDHVDAIHKLVHLATINVAIHALALLFHISDPSKGTSDRYYTSLYRKLTNPDIFNTSHSALLFSLIYKSLKQDKNIPRVAAFIKRLLQLCCYMSPAQSCGMLFVISQVLKDGDKKEAVRLLWTKREIKEEVKEETQASEVSKLTDDDAEESVLNKTDGSVAEVKEDGEAKIENSKMDLLKGDKKDLLIDDDDEETYVDLKIDESGNIKPKKRKPSTATLGWYHARVKTGEEAPVENKPNDKASDSKIQLKRTLNIGKVVSDYDPWTRNPCFAGATHSAYVELVPLSNHYHPTVKLFAEKLINEQIIQYSGDPLKDFAGIRFLDRFVFKNPKRRELDGEEGVKKVKGSHPKFAVRKNYVAKGLKSIPINSSTYLNEDSKRIPVDEKFLYDFLRKRRETQGSDDEDSDADSVNSEDFEQYLDTVTGSKAQDSDDEDDAIDAPGKKNKKDLGFKLKGKDNLGSLFASAEEFSTLLEDTASNAKQGSSQAVSNADNSSKKQLAWEEKRDRWIQGYNKKIHGNKKAGKFNRKQNGGKFRNKQNGGKFSNKQNDGFNKMANGKKGGKRKGGKIDGGGGKKKKFD
ncbi:hypothetical protein evm_001466 [Chilo suppressalis]|nr:hypothetical protein evm_001466 [Chilo suppressalis]